MDVALDNDEAIQQDEAQQSEHAQTVCHHNVAGHHRHCAENGHTHLMSAEDDGPEHKESAAKTQQVSKSLSCQNANLRAVTQL